MLAAWHDGHLTPSDLLTVRDALERADWLDDGARAALRGWLDPESPPSPYKLRQLEREVEAWRRGLPPKRRRSLSALEASLIAGNVDEARAEHVMELLGTAQQPLFQDGWDASFDDRGNLDSARDPEHTLDQPLRDELRAKLDGPHAELSQQLRTLLADSRFAGLRDLDKDAYREQVLRWLKLLIDDGVIERCYPNGLDKGRDIVNFVATFEQLSTFDLSLVVKFGVQTGLFAGSIEALGTESHLPSLRAGLKGELLGCFAMTERGHGSNVRALETLARYEPAQQEFVIRTPSLSAGKEWIGNAARHAHMAVVFAQLETAGESYGVHAFLVPIRDDAGQPMPGVRIEDCGQKMGLNGVDNGRLWFDDVRIPRANLLDKYGAVAEDGVYSSTIPSANKRFFTMLGTLVGGRIAVGCGATAAAKTGLTIATHYAFSRTQFPGPDGREKPLIDYLSHRMRLLPRIAAAYAFSFAQREMLVRAEGEQRAGELETLAAALKAFGTWQAIDTLQQCRESCGGQGYLTANRIDALRTDTEVFTTFEGDNTVLAQLVANNLLRTLRRSLKKAPVSTVVKSLVESVTVAVGERNPIARRDDSSESLRSLELHAAALRFREKSLLSSLARRINRRVREGEDAQDAFDACQDHALALARAHAEAFVLSAFQEAAREHAVLEPLCALYGLWRIEADLAWFLENDFLAPSRSRAVRKTIGELSEELAPRALDLVGAFGIPPNCLGPLADREYLVASGLARLRT
ncbi:MAG TPA: acyl-CoA dehydrogenase [Polyangiales bacterium]|nr:acyl-CoA dehydrogenase [Polyangiales bacterium]